MAITLSSRVASIGQAYSASVLPDPSRLTGWSATLTTNPGGRYSLANALLYANDVRVGDVVGLTENGQSETTFAMIVRGTASTLAISGAPSAASVGSSATFTPAITGGTAPYVLTVAGVLPAGRSLSGNAVVGTYLTSGPSVYSLIVTDSAGAQAMLRVALNVTDGAAPSFNGPPLPLAAGAKVAFLGHSYSDRQAQNPTAGGVFGVQVLARGALQVAISLDNADAQANGFTGRFNADIFYDTAGNRIRSSASEQLTGSHNGYFGDTESAYTYGSVNYPGVIARQPYIFGMGVAISYMDSGINDLRNGRSAALVIADKETQIRNNAVAGVWSVIQTLSYPQDGGSGYDQIATVNAWITGQAGRAGVMVCDTISLDGTSSASALAFTGDRLHLSTYGARARGAVLKPILQSMVTASTTAVTPDLDATNLFPRKGLPGTGGTVTTVTGVAPDGLNANRLSGTSTAVGSKEVITTGDEKWVMTATAVTDASAIHTFGLRAINVTTTDALGTLGINPGDWFEERIAIELDNWPGWDLLTLSDLPILSVYSEQYDSALTTAVWSSFRYDGVPNKTVVARQVNKAQPGAGNRFRWSNRLWTVSLPSSKAFGTGSIDGAGVLTITSSGTVIPRFAVGDTLAGANVTGSPTISTQLTGVPGGPGTYQTNGAAAASGYVCTPWGAGNGGAVGVAKISRPVLRKITDPTLLWNLSGF